MKEITDKLINERLEKLGFGDKQANDEDIARQNVLDHYHVKLTDDFQNGDFNIYEESTADGYEVWVACHNLDKVNISEDVYYYDGDLADVLAEDIKWSNGSENYEHIIYISDLDLGFVDEAFENLFVYLAERFEEEVIDTLEDEGYEYKLEEQTNEN
tara:strand:+ start:875 stop:1345 length:471 start_codon:yes stop_codon:yes gene_type:complete